MHRGLDGSAVEEVITDEQKDRWVGLMRSYPSDGWDGAAAVIAEHDAIVKAYERDLAAIDPEWKAQMPDWRVRR